MYKKRVNDKDLQLLAHALGMGKSDTAHLILGLVGVVRSVAYDLLDAREEIISLNKVIENLKLDKSDKDILLRELLKKKKIGEEE